MRDTTTKLRQIIVTLKRCLRIHKMHPRCATIMIFAAFTIIALIVIASKLHAIHVYFKAFLVRGLKVPPRGY